MRRTTLQFSSMLLGACILIVPLETQAFCILPNQPLYFQGPFAQHKAVPIYSSQLRWLHIGTSSHVEEIEALKIVIDMINSAGTNAPWLYYAGETVEHWPSPTLPLSPDLVATGGMVVQTDPCNFQDDWHNGTYAYASNPGSPYTTIAVRRGNGECGTGTFWYLDPDEDGGVVDDDDNRLDIIGVLAHEILHGLGLGHTNDPMDMQNCNPLHPHVLSLNSLMFAGDSYSRLWRRRLKRDDIEGLRYLYGAAARTPLYSESLSETPPNTLSWGPPTPLMAGLQINTPMSLTSAARRIDEAQSAGFTNTADEVRYLIGSWTDWSGNPVGGNVVPNPISPNNPVHSWERVVVARGIPGTESVPTSTQKREFVAWVGGSNRGTDENINNLEVAIHFRVRRGDVVASNASSPNQVSKPGSELRPASRRVRSGLHRYMYRGCDPLRQRGRSAIWGHGLRPHRKCRNWGRWFNPSDRCGRRSVGDWRC